MEIRPGTTVKLKSGGPTMTVEKVGRFTSLGPHTDAAKCKWFVGNKLEQDIFALAALDIVEGNEK